MSPRSRSGSPAMNRRQLLTALSLGGASMALPRHRWAAAGDSGPPKRLIILSSTQGSVYDHWTMKPEGMTGPGELALSSLAANDFSRSLAPLHPYRDRLLLLDGLSMATADLDLPGYRHEKGWLHAWTGTWAHFNGSELLSSAPSLDQLVAQEIARADRLGSLELDVGYGRGVCHAGHSQPLPLERDPARVWDRLFGLQASTDPLVRARGSVLSYAHDEYSQLAPRLSAAERSRLDRHFELVRDLELRLDGMRNAACTVGPLRTPLVGRFDEDFRAMGELVAAAFTCDLTRVATISLGDVPSADFGWADYQSGDVHNEFAHNTYQDAQAAEAMADYSAFHAGQMAWLISLLESIPGEDGGTLMDDTLIVWGSELADGWHGFERYCCVVAGGGWAFRTGRYLHWPYGQTPIELLVPEGTSSGSGIPHQHLLVSVAQAMGLDTDHVGLPEVESRQGVRIDLRGPLTEMY
jgi:hypothetical protein